MVNTSSSFSSDRIPYSFLSYFASTSLPFSLLHKCNLEFFSCCFLCLQYYPSVHPHYTQPDGQMPCFINFCCSLPKYYLLWDFETPLYKNSYSHPRVHSLLHYFIFSPTVRMRGLRHRAGQGHTYNKGRNYDINYIFLLLLGYLGNRRVYINIFVCIRKLW